MSPRTAPAPVVPQPRSGEQVDLPPPPRAAAPAPDTEPSADAPIPAALPTVVRDPVDAMLNWWLLAYFLLAVFAIVMVSLSVRSA
jgi:hypothetical protein